MQTFEALKLTETNFSRIEDQFLRH